MENFELKKTPEEINQALEQIRLDLADLEGLLKDKTVQPSHRPATREWASELRGVLNFGKFLSGDLKLTEFLAEAEMRSIDRSFEEPSIRLSDNADALRSFVGNNSQIGQGLKEDK